jgi:hypothetical protein
MRPTDHGNGAFEVRRADRDLTDLFCWRATWRTKLSFGRVMPYAQQSIDGEVFTDQRPVDAGTGRGYVVSHAFLRRGTQQTRRDIRQIECVFPTIDLETHAAIFEGELLDVTHLLHSISYRLDLNS